MYFKYVLSLSIILSLEAWMSEDPTRQRGVQRGYFNRNGLFITDNYPRRDYVHSNYPSHLDTSLPNLPLPPSFRPKFDPMNFRLGFDTCDPATHQDAMSSIFEGLFVSDTHLTNLTDFSRQQLKKPFSYTAHINDTTKVISKTIIGEIPSPSSDGCKCCVTETAFEEFSEVSVRGKMMQVVHMETSKQIQPTGRCKNLGATCSTGGTCVQRYRVQFVLVHDTDINHYPPIRFAPSEFPSHCECMNIGVRG